MTQAPNSRVIRETLVRVLRERTSDAIHQHWPSHLLAHFFFVLGAAIDGISAGFDQQEESQTRNKFREREESDGELGFPNCELKFHRQSNVFTRSVR